MSDQARRRSQMMSSEDSVNVFDEKTNVKHEAPITIVTLLDEPGRVENFGVRPKVDEEELALKFEPTEIKEEISITSNYDLESDGDPKQEIIDIREEDLPIIDDKALPNVKHEPSVDFLLLLPPDDPIDDHGMPLPLTIKGDPEGQDENLKPNPKSKKCSVNLTKLKNYSKRSKFELYKPLIMCHQCPEIKVFNKIQEYENHKCSTFFKCNICKNTFLKPDSFEVHKCKKGDNFKCKHCEKEFTSLGSLKQHVAIHIDLLKAPCKICKKIMVKVRLPQHMRQAHTLSRLYQCDLCPLKVKTLICLENHMRSHIKPFECKICKKKFSEERYFNEHLLNHKIPNPFKCTKCSSAYTRKTSLNRHMQTAHSESRNFPCSKCKYRGKTKDDLTTHFKSHTRAYKCDVCSRKFSRSTLLNQHRILHDNPNAYQCKICLKSYSQKKDVKVHMRKQHANGDDESEEPVKEKPSLRSSSRKNSS